MLTRWPRVLRFVLGLLAVTLVLVAAAVGGLVLWLQSSASKPTLEQALRDRLGAPVSLGAVRVSVWRGVVEIDDIEVGSPEPSLTEPPLVLPRVTADVSWRAFVLSGRVVADVTATGLDVHVVKHAGTSNLPLRRGAPPTSRHATHDLALHVHRASLVLEDRDLGERVDLGEVELEVHSQSTSDLRASIRIAEASMHGIAVHDVKARGQVTDDAVLLEHLEAGIGGGRLEGEGHLVLAPATRWRVRAELSDVALDDDLFPIVAALYPPLLSRDEHAPLEGTLEAAVRLEGEGFSARSVAPSLRGAGSVELEGVRLSSSSLLFQLARSSTSTAQTASGSASFRVAEGWATLDELRLSLGRATTESLPLSGRVSLAGQLELEADLMPIVALLEPELGHRIERVTTSLPIRIEGRVDDPEIRRPTARQVGRGLAGGLINRVLEPAE